VQMANELDAADIHVLAIVDRWPNDQPGGKNVAHIRHEWPGGAEVAYSAVARLRGLGLIREPVNESPTRRTARRVPEPASRERSTRDHYRITYDGAKLLQRLREEGLDAELQ
jgi:hypothetical protein